MVDPTRRIAVQSLGLAGLLSGAAALPVVSKAARTVTKTLDLDDPQDIFTAFMKMRGSLDDGDVPHWYYGTMYAAIPGRQPFPLVEFEGSEIDYYEAQEDGSYFAWAKTVSYFKDVRSRQVLEVWDNPVTGKQVQVRPNTINVGDVHYIYSVKGMKRSDDPTPLPDEPALGDMLDWTQSGPWVWLDTARTYPPGLPMAEHQTAAGLLSELHDPDVPQVNTISNPVYIAPFPRWMEMGDTPGYSIWTGPARKMSSIEDYPKAFLARLEQDFPERLSAKPG